MQGRHDITRRRSRVDEAGVVVWWRLQHVRALGRTAPGGGGESWGDSAGGEPRKTPCVYESNRVRCPRHRRTALPCKHSQLIRCSGKQAGRACARVSLCRAAGCLHEDRNAIDAQARETVRLAVAAQHLATDRELQASPIAMEGSGGGKAEP